MPRLTSQDSGTSAFQKSSDASSCTWQPTRVPSDVSRSLNRDFRGWLIYRTRFTAPDSCLANGVACALYFQEIGDSAEARLNGHVIGTHGKLPPNASYAKHYPARFQVPRETLHKGANSNELLITVFALKRVQSGLRAPPIGLYSVDDSFHLAQKYTIRNVVIPVICFMGMFMISLVSMCLAGPDLQGDRKFSAFTRYGLAASCFLLSISEVPREYLPIGIAGFLHFGLRLLFDWSLFELVASYFDYNPRFSKFFRPFYIFGIFAFFVQFCVFCVANGGIHDGEGFDTGFLTLRIALPLLVLPHLMGIYSGFRCRKQWKGQIAIFLFALTLIFQLHDSAIFHGYISGIYYVKWYPFYIGLVFGILFVERSREARAKHRVQIEQNRQMEMIHQATVGVAHDLEEPLKGLEMACRELQRCPENRDLVKVIADTFPNKVQRIYELNRAILSYSKELSKPLVLNPTKVDLAKFLLEVEEEFRQSTLLVGIELKVVAESSPIFASFDPMQVRRVFRNLIRNAAEACTGRAGSKIHIELRRSGASKGPEIVVSDNGPGIAPEIKDRLFQPFESHGKSQGTGLGLAMSRRIIEAHSGSLALLESENGASFQIALTS